MIKVILALVLLCTTPAQPFSTYHDRQPVYCTYQDGYAQCFDTYTSSFYGNFADTVDPSGEGYISWHVSRDYEKHTDRYLVGDYLREYEQGELYNGQYLTFWLVDLPMDEEVAE